MDISSKLTRDNKIALFDSGVGQLSVYLEVKKLMPNESFVIFADQDNMPYGEKSSLQIKKYVKEATEYLIKKHNIKMMILACNTATVLALDHLRSKFKIPFVGVVPAIKPATEISKTKRIAIMSTQATAKSNYVEKLINVYAPNFEVLKLGCPGLENAVETLNQVEISRLVKKYSSIINEFNPDVVVLGCTHYPLVKKQIKENLNKGISVIDSGAAVAKQAGKVLTDLGLESLKKHKDIFYTTGDAKNFSKVASTLLKTKISAIKVNP